MLSIIATGFRFKFFVAVLLIWISHNAGAAVVHEVAWSNGCTSSGNLDYLTDFSNDGSPVTIAGSGSSTFNGCTTSGSATAGSGYLSLSVDSDVNAGTESRGYGGSATYNMSSRYSEVSVSGPGGGSSSVIPMALRFDLGGALSGNKLDIGGPAGSFDSDLRFSVVVNGGEDGVIILDEQFSIGANDGVCPPNSCFLDLNGTYQTETFDFDITQTLTITLSLSGTATTLAYNNGTAFAQVLAQDTFHFSASDAFVLPDGYVVNFADANIVDNNWIDPRPVPLPASIYLFLGAVFYLGKRRRDF